jgi:hypothetical protein
MSLIIQESLSFEEILSTLESRLLLHLLEWVIAVSLIRINVLLLVRVVVILILVLKVWHIVGLCNIVLLGIIVWGSSRVHVVSWRWSVTLRNSVDIGTQEVRVLVLKVWVDWCLCALWMSTGSWGTYVVIIVLVLALVSYYISIISHSSLMSTSNWRRWVSVNRYTLWRFRSAIHLSKRVF